MLQRTIDRMQEAIDKASERIEEGEQVLVLLERAGEDTTEIRNTLRQAKERRDNWKAAVGLHANTGHEA